MRPQAKGVCFNMLNEKETYYVDPPEYSVSATWKPVVIPQTTVSSSMRSNFLPFMRAYAPELNHHGISMEEFLRIIDGLNEVFIGHPGIRAANLAGTITGFVPSAIAQGIGTGIQFASGIGSAATSYTRTKEYVKAVNTTVFAPRGLRLAIQSTKEMTAAVGATNGIYIPNFPETNIGASQDIRMERLHALEPYIAPLTFNVPDSRTNQANWYDKLNGWQATRDTKKQEKAREKALAKAQKDMRKKHGNGKKMEKYQEKELNTWNKVHWIVFVLEEARP